MGGMRLAWGGLCLRPYQPRSSTRRGGMSLRLRLGVRWAVDVPLCCKRMFKVF
jgi:hypothetical protein